MLPWLDLLDRVILSIGSGHMLSMPVVQPVCRLTFWLPMRHWKPVGGKRNLRADGSNSFNLFGIKAGKSWRGDSVETMTTEYVNGVAQSSKRNSVPMAPTPRHSGITPTCWQTIPVSRMCLVNRMARPLLVHCNRQDMPQIQCMQTSFHESSPAAPCVRHLPAKQPRAFSSPKA